MRAVASNATHLKVPFLGHRFFLPAKLFLLVSAWIVSSTGCACGNVSNTKSRTQIQKHVSIQNALRKQKWPQHELRVPLRRTLLDQTLEYKSDMYRVCHDYAHSDAISYPAGEHGIHSHRSVLIPAAMDVCLEVTQRRGVMSSWLGICAAAIE